MFLEQFLIGNLWNACLICMMLGLKWLLRNRLSLRFQYRSWFVLDLFELYDVGKAVHFSETHTCHRLSNRSSRLTVFHTCCAAPVLSAKKPPVLPSRLS